MKPRLLDLFSCAGGAGMGYHRAGFDVVGVDIKPQPNYPFEHHVGDALQYLGQHGHEFDAIHASPPCQRYSTATPAHRRETWPDLLEPTRDLLHASGRPWIMENVAGARRAMDHAVLLCGSSFGLRVRRHRYFESSALLRPLPCEHAAQGEPVGVYGQHGDARAYPRPGTGTSRAVKARDAEDARDAMGMAWGTWLELAEAVPPAYTEWLGGQLLDEIAVRS